MDRETCGAVHRWSRVFALRDTIAAVLVARPILSLVAALQMASITMGGQLDAKTRVRGMDLAGEGCIGARALVGPGRHQGIGYGCDETVVDPSRQYNGRVFDPGTGFHDYGARMYWPEIGRFISPDTAGPDFSDPRTLNRYSYVLNNPYRYVDPTGKSAIDSRIGTQNATRLAAQMAAYSVDESNPSVLRAAAAVVGAIASLSDAETAWKAELVVTAGSVAMAGAGKVGAAPGPATTSEASAAEAVGRRGTPIEIQPGRNAPATIEGRDYSGHALDRMQGRGQTPSVVENTIKTGKASPGSMPGTTKYSDPVNNTKAVVNTETGRVVTVY